jgi:hypothetical protein
VHGGGRVVGECRHLSVSLPVRPPSPQLFCQPDSRWCYTPLHTLVAFSSFGPSARIVFGAFAFRLFGVRISWIACLVFLQQPAFDFFSTQFSSFPASKACPSLGWTGSTSYGMAYLSPIFEHDTPFARTLPLTVVVGPAPQPRLQLRSSGLGKALCSANTLSTYSPFPHSPKFPHSKHIFSLLSFMTSVQGRRRGKPKRRAAIIIRSAKLSEQELRIVQSHNRREADHFFSRKIVRYERRMYDVMTRDDERRS